MATTPQETPIVGGIISAGTSAKGTDVYIAVDTTDTTDSSGGTTKTYNLTQFFNFIVNGLGFVTYPNIQAASITNLNAVYNNGTAGVNATLTNAGTKEAFHIDNEFGILNARYLIKDQSNPAQNGIYSLSVLGNDTTTNWVLTRAMDFNSNSNIIDNACVYIPTGLINKNTCWQLDFSAPVVMGTTLLNWGLFNLIGVNDFNWNVITSNSANLSRNNGYITTNVAQTTFTLPLTANIGDTYKINGYGLGGWKVAQNASQQIIVNTSLTTAGIAGYISSTNRYNTIELTCIVANSIWQASYYTGTITVN